jgi:hypothetical protein
MTPSTRTRRAFLTACTGAAAAVAGCSSDSDDSSPLDTVDGDGSDSDPYVITDATELQAMADDLDAAYRLGGDIPAGDTSGWNDGAGFDPVGGPEAPFTGSLDGRGHEIQNLHVDREADNVGLFGRVDGASVRVLTLVDARVTGHERVGTLAGDLAGDVRDCTVRGTSLRGTRHVGGVCGSSDGTLTDVHATGVVSGDGNVGGIVGQHGVGPTLRDTTSGGVIGGSSAVAAVTARRTNAGGLVGNSSYDETVIRESFADGSVSAGERAAGGLVGANSARVERSFTRASVVGGSMVAGAVGWNESDGVLTESHAGGRAFGDGDAAGLVGRNGGRIDETYATTAVESDGAAYGLVADTAGEETATASYWDIKATGAAESANGTGLTTTGMQGQTAIESMPEFDFEETWRVRSRGYPSLRWASTEE